MIKRGKDEKFLKTDGDAVEGFTCKCDKCGSDDVLLVNSLAMGSSWTGMYGSIYLVCTNCGNTAELYS